MPSNSFYRAPVTQTQVFTLSAGLKGNKASLIVPNKLIKLATQQLSAPFTEIYNESMLSGVILKKNFLQVLVRRKKLHAAQM